ncbi:uncharacterized protein LOC144141422 [Haemaphysalis longicornis]
MQIGSACMVDIIDCVSNTTVEFRSNYTFRGIRYSDKYTGHFIDRNRKPRSMLIKLSGNRIWLDTLVYSSPNNTCGVFQFVMFGSDSLTEVINKSDTWLDEYRRKNVTAFRKGERSLAFQCHLRVPGNSTHPYLTDACDQNFHDYCGEFTPDEKVYSSACTQPQK